MKVIGFIGYVDKTDFIIAVSKMLTICNKRVLIFDATTEQRLKYIMPSIENIMQPHITNFDGLYGAVNFKTLENLEKYTAERNIKIDEYDYMIVDVDTPQSYQEFIKRGYDELYFFFEHSPVCIAKNLELMKGIFDYKLPEQEIKMSKVIYKLYLTRASEVFYESKFNDYDVKWESEPIEIPEDLGDRVASIENSFANVIEFKKFSSAFKNTAMEFAAKLLGEGQIGFVKKTVKDYERRNKLWLK